MALGFDLGAGIYAVPDKQLSRSTTPKVKIATFGDGYEQRLQDGINSLGEAYSVAFVTRTKEDIDDIVYFFNTKRGVVSFGGKNLRAPATPQREPLMILGNFH